jgi:hypothetical protein
MRLPEWEIASACGRGEQKDANCWFDCGRPAGEQLRTITATRSDGFNSAESRCRAAADAAWKADYVRRLEAGSRVIGTRLG